MKTKIGILVLAICTSYFSVQAQQTVTTTRATSYDISDNLDLDAVASIFGDSENLEDFEYRLNNPETRISNLDLNEDGYIDYLRVLEISSDRNSLVVIQAVLEEDVFQDVATIEIEKVDDGNLRVQIVGDFYIYGSNYIIEPVYVRTPLIFSFFWGPRYITYQSPYYWGHYPSWYSYYRPYPTFKYHSNINVHINRHNTYHRTADRRIHFSGDNYNQIRRRDLATRYPDRAFGNRHEGLKNKQELIERRPNSSVNRQGSDNKRSTDRQYQDNRKSTSVQNEGQRNVNENKRQATPNVKSGTNQTRTRQNSDGGRSVSRSKSTSTPNKSATRVESTKQNTDSRSQTISKPASNKSESPVKSVQRNSAPREKSGSVSVKSQSNREVKQAAKSTIC